MGELADIADLAVLVEQASMTWTILAQGAKELHDQALVAVATSAREHNRRQLAWLRTQIEHEAPDAIAVVPSPGRKIETALPARPGDVAAIPDALWVPLVAGGLLLAVGALGLLARQPWLLPSLGPTAVLLALMPAHPTARPWNIFAGHLGGLLAGFAAVAVLGAASAPTVLGDGQLTPIRVLAAGIAVASTVVIGDLTRATHPPAAATTLLVALGSISRPSSRRSGWWAGSRPSRSWARSSAEPGSSGGAGRATRPVDIDPFGSASRPPLSRSKAGSWTATRPECQMAARRTPRRL